MVDVQAGHCLASAQHASMQEVGFLGMRRDYLSEWEGGTDQARGAGGSSRVQVLKNTLVVPVLQRS